MNELLDAMTTEIHYLGCNGTELDDKMADSLRRIVQRTREIMLDKESRNLIDKYRSMFPPKLPEPPQETRPFHWDDLRVQRNTTDSKLDPLDPLDNNHVP